MNHPFTPQNISIVVSSFAQCYKRKLWRNEIATRRRMAGRLHKSEKSDILFNLATSGDTSVLIGLFILILSSDWLIDINTLFGQVDCLEWGRRVKCSHLTSVMFQSMTNWSNFRIRCWWTTRWTRGNRSWHRLSQEGQSSRLCFVYTWIIHSFWLLTFNYSEK